MKTDKTSKDGYVPLKYYTLPLSAKMIIGILLLALTIAIIATTDPAVVKTISSLFYAEQVVKYQGDSANRVVNKFTAAEYGIDIQDGSQHIEVKVDQYPFFSDEHDIATYDNY